MRVKPGAMDLVGVGQQIVERAGDEIENFIYRPVVPDHGECRSLARASIDVTTLAAYLAVVTAHRVASAGVEVTWLARRSRPGVVRTLNPWS